MSNDNLVPEPQPSVFDAVNGVLQDAVDSIENGRLWFGNQIIVGHISSVLCSEGFGDGVLQPFPA